MREMLPTLVVLGAAALAALGLTRARPSPPERSPDRRAASLVLALATGVQAVHFSEELSTGFPERLGAVFGLPAMSLSFFVTFNVAWLVVWTVSVPGVRRGHPAAFFAAWFLAIAGMANGVLHPLLAMGTGGYFPGLATSPLMGLAGAWLFLRLRAATR